MHIGIPCRLRIRIKCFLLLKIGGLFFFCHGRKIRKYREAQIHIHEHTQQKEKHVLSIGVEF